MDRVRSVFLPSLARSIFDNIYNQASHISYYNASSPELNMLARTIDSPTYYKPISEGYPGYVVLILVVISTTEGGETSKYLPGSL